jgi:hypothetical protein
VVHRISKTGTEENTVAIKKAVKPAKKGAKPSAKQVKGVKNASLKPAIWLK